MKGAGLRVSRQKFIQPASNRALQPARQMGHIWGVLETWVKHRVWGVYDAHGRAYLILGGIAWAALSADGNADPWIARSSVWGIVVLALSATIHAGRRKPGR